MGLHERKKISWHLKDLLGRDIRVVNDVVKWSAPGPGDIERRAYPKRLAARWAAAKMIQAAIEEGNSGLFTHILDRTEGKVADVVVQVDGNQFVEQLEAARQRVLSQYNPVTVEGQVVQSQIDAGNTLDTQSSSKAAVPGQVMPASPSPAGGPAQGPIPGSGPMSIPPLTPETE